MKDIDVVVLPSTGWKRALNAARRTVGKKPLDKEPSSEWKKEMLIAEHSPIRLVEYEIYFNSIKQWVTVHLIRHWLGFIPFVHSQREDRRELGMKRDDVPQGSLNDMEVVANAQALINVSRKRLCGMASKETRSQWQGVKDSMECVDKEMAEAMVPNCIYRGFCTEGKKSCGYFNTDDFRKKLEEYRKLSPNE